MEMAKIGPGIAGGNNRQTVTDEDGEGRHLFKRWCEAAGLEMGVDEMGTMFARREGTDPDALPVYVGSHLDTQPTGGKYDGVLGVLGGLEVIRSLNDLGIKTKHPIVVTNWTNEEGTRFAPAMMASGVFAGVLDQADVYAAHRQAGQEVRRRAGAHRLEGRREGRRPQDARLLRTAYRAGADPRGRRHRHRRRHPRPGPEVAAGDADRQGGAYRLDADAQAPQCRPRHGARHRTGARDRDGLPARRRRRGRPHGGLSQLAQHHRRPHRLHHRHPLAGKGSAGRDGRRASAKASTRSARRSTSSSRSSRSAISIRSPSTRAASRRSAMPPNGSAIRTATSSRAPATTPAGSTASRRPPW